MRHVLLNTWDPIRVNVYPEAQDEYNGYIGKLFDLLASGAPDSDLVDYLFWPVHEDMGMECSRDDMLPTVAALRKIDFSPDGDSQAPHS